MANNDNNGNGNNGDDFGAATRLVRRRNTRGQYASGWTRGGMAGDFARTRTRSTRATRGSRSW